MHVILYDVNGNEHDITEKVEFLAGQVRTSLEWGSGMLDDEEMLDVNELGILMGLGFWNELESLEKYKRSLEYSLESDRCGLRKINDKTRTWYQEKLRETELKIEKVKAVGIEEQLAQIAKARANLKEQTDDVTDFDEEN